VDEFVERDKGDLVEDVVAYLQGVCVFYFDSHLRDLAVESFILFVAAHGRITC